MKIDRTLNRSRNIQGLELLVPRVVEKWAVEQRLQVVELELHQGYQH